MTRMLVPAIKLYVESSSLDRTRSRYSCIQKKSTRRSGLSADGLPRDSLILGTINVTGCVSTATFHSKSSHVPIDTALSCRLRGVRCPQASNIQLHNRNKSPLIHTPYSTCCANIATPARLRPRRVFNRIHRYTRHINYLRISIPPQMVLK